MPRRRIATAAVSATLVAAAAAATLGGCGSDSPAPGPSTSRQIVLIQSSRSVAGAVSLAGVARAQAARAGYRLRVEDPARPTASDQIALIDTVIASKPAAVVIMIVPDGADALAASLESMRSAGIEVVEIDHGGHAGAGAAREGSDAVRRAVNRLPGR